MADLTRTITLLSVLATAACNQAPESERAHAEPATVSPIIEVAETEVVPNPAARKAWFGETHVHTDRSFDAFIYNVRVSPDDAYRFAKGEKIDHTSGVQLQAARAIDFMAVTDHAEYLGVLPQLDDPESELSKTAFAKELIQSDKSAADAAFGKLASSLIEGKPIDELRPDHVVKSNWQRIISAAERHYDPGNFTTLIGYEWTSLPNSRNLHRNVIFRGGPQAVPELPFSSLDSWQPEELWRHMDELRQRGIESLAIPHNANLSDGMMFPSDVNSKGEPLDAAYADARNRNEPLVEISQIKGSSETHPLLSPNDEWASFEIVGELIGSGETGKVHGSYARQAYLDGLKMMQSKGFNPYTFGFIGATDSHNGAAVADENNYPGKTGISDDTIGKRRTAETAGLKGRDYSGAGLAGVWAEQNTRESIFDAMARRETFASSGPRITARFFAGWNYSNDLLNKGNWPATAYQQGVAMGATLDATETPAAPRFLAWAEQDPEEAPLQRLQIVKGWVTADGDAQEQVFDIACSDGGVPDADTWRCPDNGASVNLDDCSFGADKGDAILSAQWKDPNFNPEQPSFYYLRAIQNPTCRWSSWDAVRAGLPFLDDVPKLIQERAWSSPIKYQP